MAGQYENFVPFVCPTALLDTVTTHFCLDAMENCWEEGKGPAAISNSDLLPEQVLECLACFLPCSIGWLLCVFWPGKRKKVILSSDKH